MFAGTNSVRFLRRERLRLLLFIINQDERRGVFSLLKRFGDDDGDGLAVEIHLVRVEILNARRCRTRLFALLSKDCGLLHRGRVLVREDTDDARCGGGRAYQYV